MKKIVMILALATLFSVQAAQAQKYGHVNSSEILEVMPGIDSLQIKLQAFQQDLQAMYEPAHKRIWKTNSTNWPNRSKMPSKKPSTKWPRLTATRTFSTRKPCCITAVPMISPRW